ncbi:hypothetical protein Q8F55_008778 [Vanrija albida]|uniref:Uncharacterized protein n=1 Tax=Vanrija albida TaxID=181172 RepID=A0ABR3PSR4_9TREE
MKTLLAVLVYVAASVIAAPVPAERGSSFPASLTPATHELDDRQIWGGWPPRWKRADEPQPVDMGDDKLPERQTWGEGWNYWKQSGNSPAGGIWIDGPILKKRDGDDAPTSDTPISDTPTSDAATHDAPAPDAQRYGWGWWGWYPWWKRDTDASATPDAQSGSIWGGVAPHWKRIPAPEADATAELDSRQIWGGWTPRWKREPEGLVAPASS